MTAGKLDRRVQFRRATLADDGYTTAAETWANLGSPVWASLSDISDAERSRASEVQAHITTRFQIRWSAFAAGITPKDRLVCAGVTYDISGIKRAGDRNTFLEITAAARAD